MIYFRITVTRNTYLYIFSFLLFTTLSRQVNAQIGGDAVYKFLNLTSSARAAAVGGSFMAVDDGDLSMALFNPSIINPRMDNNLSMSFVDYFAGVNYGFASYANSFREIGSYAATVQYISYGDFTYADETGQTYGNFGASELALNLGWGRKLDSLFMIGANLKFIHSGLEDYTSCGLAVDIAGSYVNPKHQLTVSLVARNIGTQLKPYRDSNTEKLPLEINLGISQRLKHMPFRYSILLTNLQKWDLTYDDPNDPANNVDPITGEVVDGDNASEFLDKAMRHVVIGGEFLPTKNLTLRFGYNYQRRQELGVYNKMGTVGFSWGIGVKISKFQIDYARATYHLNGSPNYFTIRTNLSDLF
ncbi:MAG: type IX secretion system protein PorQ [Sphingobacteriia bacterium]|nr:type IX secretion system protein PorQ [Sphingobacteriia bacterium]